MRRDQIEAKEMIIRWALLVRRFLGRTKDDLQRELRKLDEMKDMLTLVPADHERVKNHLRSLYSERT